MPVPAYSSLICKIAPSYGMTHRVNNKVGAQTPITHLRFTRHSL